MSRSRCGKRLGVEMARGPQACAASAASKRLMLKTT